MLGHAWSSITLTAILVCSASGAIVIYEGLRSSLRGEYLHVNVGRIEIEIPKNWRPQAFWEPLGEGNRYTIFLTGNNCTIGIFVYDIEATDKYFEDIQLASARDAVNAGAKKAIQLYQKENVDAKMESLDNGTVLVAGGKEAQYGVLLITGLRGGEHMKISITAFVYDGLIEFHYIGTPSSWEANLSLFTHSLNSVKF